MPMFSPPSLLRKPQPRLIAVQDPGHLGFDYTIRLSSRKSAAIEVRAGKVLVAAPLRATQTELKQWVTAKADWIRDKLAQQSQRHQQIPQRLFQDGERWPWLGEPLTLRVVSGSRNGCERRAEELVVSLSKRAMSSQTQSSQTQSSQTQSNQAQSSQAKPDQAASNEATTNRDTPSAPLVQKALQGWYQHQALVLLEQKTEAVCQQLQQLYPQAQCQRVQLRRTKSKWGHCTRQGVIQYNWLIAQAPEWVVDYLVVHECCHLVHHNHSRAYWALVSSLYPDYATARHWLQQHGHTLVL